MMKNLTYLEFLKECLDKSSYVYNHYEPDDLEKLEKKGYNDHDAFQKAYEDAYSQDGIEIHHEDNPMTLRIGFVVIDGDKKVWHTIRIGHWSPGRTFGAYVKKVEARQKAEEQLRKIMKDIDPDDKLAISWAMIDEEGNINHLSLWAKEIHVSSRLEE
jgi:hypothetical protein